MHYFNDTLSKYIILDLLSEQRNAQKGLQLDCEWLKSYFPKDYTIKQCEEQLWKVPEK